VWHALARVGHAGESRRGKFLKGCANGRFAASVSRSTKAAFTCENTRFTERRGSPPQTVAADTTYGNGEMLDWLEQHSITGHIPVKESPFVNNGLYDVEQFTYRPYYEG